MDVSVSGSIARRRVVAPSPAGSSLPPVETRAHVAGHGRTLSCGRDRAPARPRPLLHRPVRPRRQAGGAVHALCLQPRARPRARDRARADDGADPAAMVARSGRGRAPAARGGRTAARRARRRRAARAGPAGDDRGPREPSRRRRWRPGATTSKPPPARVAVAAGRALGAGEAPALRALGAAYGAAGVLRNAALGRSPTLGAAAPGLAEAGRDWLREGRRLGVPRIARRPRCRRCWPAATSAAPSRSRARRRATSWRWRWRRCAAGLVYLTPRCWRISAGSPRNVSGWPSNTMWPLFRM